MRYFLRFFQTDEHLIFLIGSRLTQSCLESLFSRVRQLGGGGTNPTQQQYDGAIATTRVTAEARYDSSSGENRSNYDAVVNAPRFYVDSLSRVDRRHKETTQPRYIPLALPRSTVRQDFVLRYIQVHSFLLTRPRMFVMSGYPSMKQFEHIVRLIVEYQVPRSNQPQDSSASTA